MQLCHTARNIQVEDGHVRDQRGGVAELAVGLVDGGHAPTCAFAPSVSLSKDANKWAAFQESADLGYPNRHPFASFHPAACRIVAWSFVDAIMHKAN